MKRFSFHLEALLRLRLHKEEEWRLKLGEASTRCNTILRNIEALREEERLTSAKDAGGIDYYRSRELYLGRIRNTIATLEQDYAEAELEREKTLATYIEIQREYKIVQTIKEKRSKEYRRAWFKAENKEIDDIVNARIAGGFGE